MTSSLCGKGGGDAMCDEKWGNLPVPVTPA